MDADKLDELERLLAGLRAIVASYEKKNPLRTADFHGEGCGCYRCAVDGCSAAINALPELVAMGRRVAETEATEMRYRSALRQILIEYNEHDSAGIDVIAGIARNALEAI